VQLLSTLLDAGERPDEQLRRAALDVVAALAAPLCRHSWRLLPQLLRAASDGDREVRNDSAALRAPCERVKACFGLSLTHDAMQVCTAASNALEGVLDHAGPGQCLPLLQSALQADLQRPDRPGDARSLQVSVQHSTAFAAHLYVWLTPTHAAACQP